MGDTGEQLNLTQILDVMRIISDRITQLEQRPPPPREPIRNVNEPRVQENDEETDEDMPGIEEDNPEPNRRPRRQVQRERDRYRDRDRDRDRGREREGAEDLHGGKDLKLTAPTFSGKVNPEAYLDWERRMEYIFEYYQYSDARKISLAAAQLTDNALAWWDREVTERRRLRREPIHSWDDMRFQLRKRYVPSYYYRDLQKRFRKLSQGSKSVEEYFEEFETLKNRLEVEDSKETLMAQFLDGLQDRIARKVERQNYEDLEELLHFAIQAEQHIKRKTAATTRNRSNWNQPPQKSIDKGKSIEVENRFKKPTYGQPKTNKPDQDKASTQRTRDISCFKCQGKGHYARECPNQRVMILKADGEYESQDEEEAEQVESEEEVTDYPEVELLVPSLNQKPYKEKTSFTLDGMQLNY